MTNPDARARAAAALSCRRQIPSDTKRGRYAEHPELAPVSAAERQYREQAQAIERMAAALAAGTVQGPRHATVARLVDAVQVLAAWTPDDRA